MRGLVLAALLCACKGSEPASEAPIPTVATGTTPEVAFRNYQRAVTADDLDFLWSFVSDKDKHRWLDKKLAPMTGSNVPAARMAEFAAAYKMTPEAIRAMSKHDFDRHFIGMLAAKGAALVPAQKIVKTTVAGDMAELALDVPASKFAMIREDGQWHWDLMGTTAANK